MSDLTPDTLLRPPPPLPLWPHLLVADVPPPQVVTLASVSPHVLVVDDFLEPKLCDELVRLAAPRLIRSKVSAGERGGSEGRDVAGRWKGSCCPPG